MEYERIHKPQTGLISPSKLRMKLIGHRIKDGTNSNSSRTSPNSKLEDAEFVKNSLLAANSENFDDQVAACSSESYQGDQTHCQPKDILVKESGGDGHVKVQHFSKIDIANLSTVHPFKILEDENLDYDSNASSSSFEFHKGERSSQNQFARSFSRSMPSKWNDAEKWIINKHTGQPSNHKKNALYNQTNRLPATNMVRVAPELACFDHKSSHSRVVDTKQVDFCQNTTHKVSSKFCFTPPENHLPAQEGGEYGHPLSESDDLEEVDHSEFPCTRNLAEETAVVPAIRSVCMRDMGTEMTPVPSQEPSRTATPTGATTPMRSPTSSIPSTPRGTAPGSTHTENNFDEEKHSHTEYTRNTKMELSEQEMKVKTRKEIVALGVQLGKTSIANWASKEEMEKNTHVETTDMEKLERVEFEKRAAMWEEAERSKHFARCKREEIKIQAWENQQKAKLEAEMRRVEAKVEQMRVQAKAKLVKKISMAKQRSEEKRILAEVRKNRDAEKTAMQLEHIRQTGRMPSSQYMCCTWFS